MTSDPYQAIFQNRGEIYHQAMLNCPFARQTEFENMISLADIKDGHRVCDVPSGGGYIQNFVSRKIDLICVDSSFQFIQNKNSPNLKKILGSLESLPLKGSSLDRVLSLAGLHHFDDKLKIFQEILRVLRPGGKFCIADVSEFSSTAEFLNVFVDKHNSMGHKGVFFDDSTKEQLNSLGFKLFEAKCKKFFWKFSSLEMMTDFCRNLFGIDKIDNKGILKGIDHYLGVFRSNGSYCMNWELMYLAGIKND